MARTKQPLPQVTVWDRRMENPFGSGSVEVQLKDRPEVMLYVASNRVRPGAVHDLVHNKGWSYVTPEDLEGRPDDWGFEVRDGRLVRGEHGEEVLLKMDRSRYLAIQHRKAELNTKNLGGRAGAETAAQETALKYGSQAGDTVYQSMSVQDSRERVELDPEDHA